MLSSFSLPTLIFLFLLASAIVWFAGVHISNLTDLIDLRFGFGQVMGGLIFLAVVTNLPEIAIMTSAALSHHIGIAVGNILGGIAIQTVVLVLLDGIGLKSKASLTYKAACLQLILEGLLVISILVIAIMSCELPQSLIIGKIAAPGDILMFIAWAVGIWLIYKVGVPNAGYVSSNRHLLKMQQWTNLRICISFIIMAILILFAGTILELCSNSIAHAMGWSGVLFGSTILAAITALPEVSTGLAAMKNGDYALAFSDILGGNAFLPVLFLPATLLSGYSVLPQAQASDIYLASLGALLTCVYVYGLIFKPKMQICCLGIDSVVVLMLYILGIIGLFYI